MNKYALTGASYPLPISGKEFSASSLTDKDYVELDAYIQTKIVEIARRQLDGLAPDERSEILQAAIKAAASSGWGTQEGSRIICTVEGSSRLGWQMLLKKHPKLKFEDFYKLVIKDIASNMSAIDEVFTILNLSGEVRDADGAPEVAPTADDKSGSE